MTFWVGLTGSIGSGKSTVSTLFSTLNVPIIDTDQISRSITAKGGIAIPIIIEKFGEAFIDMTGALEREKMRQLIFSSSSQQAKLESILHPLIEKEIKLEQQKIAETTPYGIIEIPLLAEKKQFKKLVDRVLLVYSSPDLQIKRVMQRNGLSKEVVLSIMDKQANHQQRLLIADDIIENDATLVSLEQEVLKIHHKYMELFSHAG